MSGATSGNTSQATGAARNAVLAGHAPAHRAKKLRRALGGAHLRWAVRAAEHRGAVVLRQWRKVHGNRALRKVRQRSGLQGGAQAAMAGNATLGLRVRACPVPCQVCATVRCATASRSWACPAVGLPCCAASWSPCGCGCCGAAWCVGARVDADSARTVADAWPAHGTAVAAASHCAGSAHNSRMMVAQRQSGSFIGRLATNRGR